MRLPLVVVLLLLLPGCAVPGDAGPDDAGVEVATPAVVPKTAPLALDDDLVVDANTTWTNGHFEPPAPTGITPAARVTVAEGATLTIDGGVYRHVRFTVDGTLFVRGAELVLGAGPVFVHGLAVFNNSTLTSSPASLLRVEGGIVDVLDTDLRDSAGDAVHAVDGHVFIDSGSWHDVAGYGVFSEGGTVGLQHVQALDTSEYGVRMEGGTLRIWDSTFAQECGVYVRGGEAIVQTSHFLTSRHGVTAFDADLVLADSSFDGPEQAVLLSNATARLSDLVVRNVDVGVDAFTSTVEVADSFLSAAVAGLRTLNGTLGVADSDLVGPGLGLHADGTLVDAPSVWWGADPPVVEVVGYERTTWRSAPATGERSDA